MNKKLISGCLITIFTLLFVTTGYSGYTEKKENLSSMSHNDQFWPFSSDKKPLVDPPMPDSVYFYQYLIGHNVFTNSIQLLDGSIWYGPYNTGLIASQWLGTDPVILSPNKQDRDQYQFCATNQRTGETLKLNLGEPPLTGSPYARCISAVDGNGVIELCDGSVWIPSPYDKKVVSDWWIYDGVIIGLNHGKDSNVRPNILINVAKKTHAACTFSK